jgi:hypothetical protein
MLNILEKSKYNVPDNISNWKIPRPNPKFINKTINEEYDIEYDEYDNVYQESADENNNGSSIRVTIPAASGSIINDTVLEVPCHNLLVDFNDDVVTFTTKGAGKMSKSTFTNTQSTQDVTDKNDEISTLRTKKPAFGSGKLCIYLMSNKQSINEFCKSFELFEKVLFKPTDDNIKKFNETIPNILKKIKSEANNMDKNEIKIKLKEIVDFQKRITECYDKIEKFGDFKTDVSEFSKQTIDNMNDMSFMLLNIQKSINIISSSIDQNSIIDGRFFESIKSVSLLEMFVKQCVENGLPSKYICYNTWLIADKCIKGNNNFKPIWGQTRFVFFPPKARVIYKIAMNGAGVSANKAEINISQLFTKMDRIDLIAPVVKTFGDDMIIAMERIKGDSKRPSYQELLTFTARCNDSIKLYEKSTKQQLNIKISDQHKDNVMYDTRYGIFRSIDYGVETRVYKK